MRHRIRRSISLGAAALGLASLALGAGPDPLRPASSGGLVALDLALARLATHQRLLILAAHPDDEDTRLLTWVTRGRGGEAAYLSLCRGEGGQNLIGPELGPALGLLRSRELLAARRIDGARQLFTRAYDFGYTRSLEETLARWPREVLVADAVRVVRRFKPQVLVAIFPPTARAGHGQHWASGVVAEEVFARAGDPEAFPELEREGLAPWTIDAFYRLVITLDSVTPPCRTRYPGKFPEKDPTKDLTAPRQSAILPLVPGGCGYPGATQKRPRAKRQGRRDETSETTGTSDHE